MGFVEDFDEKLAGLVNRERGEVYGHPLDNFARIAALQLVVSACPDPEIRVALDAICVKIARLIQTPNHMDSILDIAGYARTMAMIHDERAARNKLYQGQNFADAVLSGKVKLSGGGL